MTSPLSNEPILEPELAPIWLVAVDKASVEQQDIAIRSVDPTTQSRWVISLTEGDIRRPERFADNAATASTVILDADALVQQCLKLWPRGLLGHCVPEYSLVRSINAIRSFTRQDIGHLACGILATELASGISLLAAEGQGAANAVELGHGREALMGFDQHARKIVEAEGIRVISARIREWA